MNRDDKILALVCLDVATGIMRAAESEVHACEQELDEAIRKMDRARVRLLDTIGLVEQACLNVGRVSDKTRVQTTNESSVQKRDA